MSQNKIVTVKRDADGFFVTLLLPHTLSPLEDPAATHINIRIKPHNLVVKKGDKLNIRLHRYPESGRFHVSRCGSGQYAGDGDRALIEGPKLFGRNHRLHIFEKEYDGESIVDLTRDISECFDERFNEAVKRVPEMKDSPGFWAGKFVVSVTWKPDEEK